MARAIVQSPPLLLADEPTGALDSTTSLQVLELLRRLHREGMTIVIVTHDRAVASYTGRMITFADGQLQGDIVQGRHASGGAPPIDPARVVTASRGTLAVEILETGRVEPREKVELKSKLAGEVVAVRADEGDRVRRGDLLVELDPTDFEREVAAVEAELERTRAAIDFARATLARKRRAVEERVLPSAELDVAEHELRACLAEQRMLEVRLGAARDRVRYTRIGAPMYGTVIPQAPWGAARGR